LGKRGAQAFPGSGKRATDELARLRKELEQVKEERDILKKAAAYFAKELK
jgi:transposase